MIIYNQFILKEDKNMENYLDLKKSNDYTKLNIPGEVIKKGGIVVFPTETVYGIGTNGLDANAVKKLYDIKKRPLDKPISLLVSDLDMINKIAKDITKKEYELMKKFFPGPLTIILKKKDIIPDIVTANTDTIGIRMPSNEITRKLIQCAGVPIAAPSANISGEPSNTNLDDLINIFKENVDYYIDGGECKIGTASTIVKVIDEVPHILRNGSIREEEIL